MSVTLKLILIAIVFVVVSVITCFIISASDKRYWEERDKADMERYLKNRRMNYPDIICEKRKDNNNGKE